MSVLVRFEGGRAAHRYKKGHVNLMAQIVLCGDGDGKEKLLQYLFNLIKGRPSTLLIYYVGRPLLHDRDFPHNSSKYYCILSSGPRYVKIMIGQHTGYTARY